MRAQYRTDQFVGHSANILALDAKFDFSRAIGTFSYARALHPNRRRGKVPWVPKADPASVVNNLPLSAKPSLDMNQGPSALHAVKTISTNTEIYFVSHGSCIERADVPMLSGVTGASSPPVLPGTGKA